MERSAVRRLAVVGSRDFTDQKAVDRYVRLFPNITTIISGGARGVDATARVIAERMGLEFVEFRPDWKRYGRGAGPVRNRQIVEAADGVLAFLASDSRGTADAIRQAERAGVPVWVVGVKDGRPLSRMPELYRRSEGL